MNTLAGLMVAAALLPVLAACIAKAGGKGFDNNDPRLWLAHQQGWRGRANSAQSNTFEALPFFYGAVAFALYTEAPVQYLITLIVCWLAARLAYLGFYLSGQGSLRSLAWIIGLGLNIAILFAANR